MKKIELTVTHVSYPSQTVEVFGNEVMVTMEKITKQMEDRKSVV